jgi:hypothetical protein
MITVESSHIQLTLSCDECGHQWDIEDYSEVSTDAAVREAEDELCPKCGEDDD